MHIEPEMIEFKDDGENIFVKKSNCQLVEYWARKYAAKIKVEWIPQKGGIPLLFDVEDEVFAAPDSTLVKGDVVWAVPSPTMGAFNDANLIRQLVFAKNVENYNEIRQSLSVIGYPDHILDTIPVPK